MMIFPSNTLHPLIFLVQFVCEFPFLASKGLGIVTTITSKIVDWISYVAGFDLVIILHKGFHFVAL